MDDLLHILRAAGPVGADLATTLEAQSDAARPGPLGDAALAALIARGAPAGDPEHAHRVADALLLRELHALGYRQAIAAWLAAEKWFN